MNDPLDSRITQALRTEATLDPDSAAAHTKFVERRRRRRRAQAGAALAAMVVIASVVGVAVARTGGHKPKVGLTAAGGEPTTQPESQPGPPVFPGVGTTDVPNAVGGGSSGSSRSACCPTANTTRPQLPPTTNAPATTAPAVGPGPQARTVTVTDADSGKSYTLHKGDRLVVQLQGSTYEWTEPASSNDAALHRTGGSGGTSASATFSATASGTASVTSTGDLPCRKSTPPCMAPSRLFQISVTVV